MRLSWFENSDNVAYVEFGEFVENFGKEVGVAHLGDKIEEFRKNPIPEGIMITGTKRTALKIFIPDLVFDKHIDMGESVWIFIGEMYPAYCIYWKE